MDNYVVYITTNLINNKKYIGSDSKNNPSYLGSGTGIVKALKKYGKKNFKKEILATASTFKFMRELEEYYIKYYNAHISSLFYNRSDKGQGQGSGKRHWNFGKVLNETTKNKKRNSMLGKTIHNTISKSKISQKMKNHWKDNPNLKNRILPNIRSNTYKPILQYDFEGNLVKGWESIKKASNSLNINRRGISNCLTGISSTSGGYIWKYNNEK